MTVVSDSTMLNSESTRMKVLMLLAMKGVDGYGDFGCCVNGDESEVDDCVEHDDDGDNDDGNDDKMTGQRWVLNLCKLICFL